MKRSVLLFALVLFVAVGCRRHGADGVPFENFHDIDYKPVSEDASPVEPSTVEIYDLLSDRPEGIRFSESGPIEKRAEAAQIYGHRVLGMIELKERIDVPTSYGDVLNDEWNNPALRVRREKLLAAEAARHGANRLYLNKSFIEHSGGLPEHNRTYWAIYLSPDPPKYPDVETLLGRLDLSKDGFKEVKRFTAKLQDLPGRAPETIQLERGNCYMLAIAFRPEPIDRPHDRVTSINFKVKATKPEAFPGVLELLPGTGHFFERQENKESYSSREFLDGIWSRTGAGKLACPVIRSQPVQVSFMTLEGSAMKDPPAFAPGKGTADFVVYEQKLTNEDFTSQVCGRCIDVAHQCNQREPLGSCATLSRCLQAMGMTLGVCSERFY